jgi:hypothetical protein
MLVIPWLLRNVKGGSDECARKKMPDLEEEAGSVVEFDRQLKHGPKLGLKQ